MRKILLAGALLALSACSGSESGTDANGANALGADNMMLDQNMGLDANMMNGMAGVDANTAVDANTQNLMEKDANTHDPDTNLANGI
jgi:hypothetical protein